MLQVFTDTGCLKKVKVNVSKGSHADDCYQVVKQNSVYNSLSCRAQKVGCLEVKLEKRMKYQGFPGLHSIFIRIFLYITLKFCEVKNILNADILLTTFCVLIEIKVQLNQTRIFKKIKTALL